MWWLVTAGTAVLTLRGGAGLCRMLIVPAARRSDGMKS